MITGERETLYPFILSWGLRNSSAGAPIVANGCPSIVGTSAAVYPIDGWKPLFLEVPRGNRSIDLSGRHNNRTRPAPHDQPNNRWRLVELPIYTDVEDLDVGKMRFFIKNWHRIGIPEDVPCMGIAAKCRGFYCDFREAQHVMVLLAWSDGIARIVSLDWCEGPLEDCISPEWYVEASSLMGIEEAIRRMECAFGENHWANPFFSIYSIPPCLSPYPNGKLAESPYSHWMREWNYTDRRGFVEDLRLLLSATGQCFSHQEVETMRSEAALECDVVMGLGEKGPDEMVEPGEEERIITIIEGHECKKENLLAILLDIQEEYNYLPKEGLKLVSDKLGVPLSYIYAVATFYRAYSLEPRGKHTITICKGTACHVRGGGRISEAISRKLNINPGETTEDMEFSFEAVNCLGACALGPIVVLDNKYHGNVTPSEIEKLIDATSS